MKTNFQKLIQKSSIIVLIALALCLINKNSVFAQVTITNEDTQEATTNLTTHLITNGDEKDQALMNTFALTVPQAESASVIPIEIPSKGQLNYVLTSDPENKNNGNYASATVEFYSDEQCTKKVSKYGKTLYFNSDSTLSAQSYFTEGGTYYLKLSFSSVKPTNDYKFTFASNFLNSADRTLSNKTWTASYGTYDNKTIYYKVKTSDTGYLTVNFEGNGEYTSGNFSICDSNKKELLDEFSVTHNPSGTSYGNPAYFAVKPGTYYIKVNCSYDFYRIKSTLTKVSDSSGSSKSKATTLKLGASAKKGVVLISDKTNKVDWYKVTLTKASTITFTIAGKTSSYVNMEIEQAGGRSIWFGNTSINDSRKTSTLKSDGKFSAGTYYIKVTKNKADYNGYYTIKVTK